MGSYLYYLKWSAWPFEKWNVQVKVKFPIILLDFRGTNWARFSAKQPFQYTRAWYTASWEWWLLERKTNYEREENMVDVLDNCDDTVIHISSSNEAPMVDSDNVGDNIFTINIPSNFTSPSCHYRTFNHVSVLKNMFLIMTFQGYIIMLQMKGYECRICEMFPPWSTTEDHFRAKFASKTGWTLTDYPKCYLNEHLR